jgi:voltage-gated potassium channel Kch
MDTVIVSSAEVTFAAAGILITVSLFVLNSVWKRLELMINSLPEGRKNIFRNLRTIQDEREKDKVIFTMFHFVGCAFFIATIAFAVFSMGGVISVMLGYRMGFYQQENFETGKFCLFIASLFFTLGFFILGATYIDKIMSLVTGKPELLTTKLENLPPVTTTQLAKSKLFEKLMSIFFILLFVLIFGLEIFNPFGTGLKILVSLAAIVLFFIIVRVIMRQKFKKGKIDK